LWKVAREFDPRGYGLILREKLTDKWCDCGCSTDHLGEVCERTVREDEEANGIYHPGCGGEGAGGKGKGREWDGRGSGVYGWGTEDEEDIWEQDMDFGGLGPEEGEEPEYDPTLTVGEMVELRFVKAEKEKEMVSAAII
jgi:RNA polymerase II-associated protein 3